MTSKQSPSKTLHILLWVAQGLLSATLLWASATKLLKPAAELAAMWPWTAEHRGLVLFTAVLDLAGALGLLLPGILRIWPQLTRYAAYGILLLMIIASIFHISRGEANLIGINIVFAAIAAFIAWGR